MINSRDMDPALCVVPYMGATRRLRCRPYKPYSHRQLSAGGKALCQKQNVGARPAYGTDALGTRRGHYHAPPQPKEAGPAYCEHRPAGGTGINHI